MSKTNLAGKETIRITNRRLKKSLQTLLIFQNVMLGVPLVTMVGDRELTIENYVGIIEYGEDIIRIKCKAVNVSITGKNLELKTMTDEFLYITGRFKCFSYEY